MQFVKEGKERLWFRFSRSLHIHYPRWSNVDNRNPLKSRLNWAYRISLHVMFIWLYDDVKDGSWWSAFPSRFVMWIQLSLCGRWKFRAMPIARRKNLQKKPSWKNSKQWKAKGDEMETLGVNLLILAANPRRTFLENPHGKWKTWKNSLLLRLIKDSSALGGGKPRNIFCNRSRKSIAHMPCCSFP